MVYPFKVQDPRGNFYTLPMTFWVPSWTFQFGKLSS